MAEAGVEEAMAHLNSGVNTNNLAVNSWVPLGGGVYEKTNFLGDSYSVVDIKIRPAVTTADPVVVATAGGTAQYLDTNSIGGRAFYRAVSP